MDEYNSKSHGFIFVQEVNAFFPVRGSGSERQFSFEKIARSIESAASSICAVLNLKYANFQEQRLRIEVKWRNVCKQIYVKVEENVYQSF